MIKIINGVDCMPQIKSLLEEYTRSLNRDLTFQDIDAELADPAKKYTPPEGELLAAVEDGLVLGIVAYHRHSPSRCEMKRLYVRPDARGLGIGEKLVSGIIEHAKAAGYREMVLDTLEPMHAAIGLYGKFGFEQCEPYYHNPFEDVLYMKKELQDPLHSLN